MFLCEVACTFATGQGAVLRVHEDAPPVRHYDVAGVYDSRRRADLRYCYGARNLGIDAPRVLALEQVSERSLNGYACIVPERRLRLRAEEGRLRQYAGRAPAHALRAEQRVARAHVL